MKTVVIEVGRRRAKHRFARRSRMPPKRAATWGRRWRNHHRFPTVRTAGFCAQSRSVCANWPGAWDAMCAQYTPIAHAWQQTG